MKDKMWTWFLINVWCRAQLKRIKATLGTEFLYDTTKVTSSWDFKFMAFVAAFDPRKGFTCLALSHISETGQSYKHMNDKNGHLCLIGVKPKFYNSLREMWDSIEDVDIPMILSGLYEPPESIGGGNASCGIS